VLALVFSALFTVYLLVPEALFRLVFGFFIPSRTFVLTRTEKAYRAVLITVVPFLLAWACSWYVPGPNAWPFPIAENSVYQRRADYRAVSTAFYSDAEFAKLGEKFWQSATRCSRRQARLVSWYFLLIIIEAFFLGALAKNYPKLKNPALTWISNAFLTAMISQWHPLLPKGGDTVVQADILCVNDLLYQGEVSEYFLKDGELSGLILRKPQRFDKKAYDKAKEQDKKPEPKEYWRPIPSQNLYFFADKILNMNLTYLTASGAITDPSAVQKFLSDEIPLAQDAVKLTISVPKIEQEPKK
jgi:hypothetical protein